jgi:hypothetical protein
MAQTTRGQRDLIDYAETQHQDINAELRQQLEASEELVRQLRSVLGGILERIDGDGPPAPEVTVRLLELCVRGRELLGKRVNVA